MIKNKKESARLPFSLQGLNQRPQPAYPAKRARMSLRLPKKPLKLATDLAITDEDCDVDNADVSMPRGDARVPTDFDVLNIFRDVTKLEKIEKYLNILYRPFVCFVNTKCEFNLGELVLLISSARYDPERHSALLINRTHPICSLKVYPNGNIYAQGYNRDSARIGLKKFLSQVEDYDYKPMMNHLKFNVVNATFLMPFHVNLSQMHIGCEPHTSYSSRKAYLTYWMSEWDIKFAIFPTGFVYVMFSTQPRNTRRAIQYIMPVLYRYKKVESNPIEMFNNGDIDYKLQWEREFQREDDFSIKM